MLQLIIMDHCSIVGVATGFVQSQLKFSFRVYNIYFGGIAWAPFSRENHAEVGFRQSAG